MPDRLASLPASATSPTASAAEARSRFRAAYHAALATSTAPETMTEAFTPDPSKPRRGRPKKRLRTLSPSQAQTFDVEHNPDSACKRKWGFDKIDGEPREDKPSAILGTVCHELAENYLQVGSRPPMDAVVTWPNPYDSTKTVTRHPGQIVTAGLHLLPPPGSAKPPHLGGDGGRVEDDARFKAGGVPWFGRLDYHRWDEPTKTVIVLDHKTTGKEKYALSPEDLAEDNQAIVYAAWAFWRYPAAERVKLRWIYYRTTGAPKAWAVENTLTRAGIKASFDRLTSLGLRMLKTHAETEEAHQLPPNLDACSAYGGCSYQQICKIDPYLLQEKLAMTFENTAPAAPAAPPAPSTDAAFEAWLTANGWHEYGADYPGVYHNYQTSKYRDELLGIFKAEQPSAPPAPPAPPALLAEPAPSPAPAGWTPPAGGSDQVNAPDASAPNPEQPAPAPAEEATEDRYETMDRDALKAEAVARGLADSSDRRREKGLRDALRSDDLERKKTGLSVYDPDGAPAPWAAPAPEAPAPEAPAPEATAPAPEATAPAPEATAAYRTPAAEVHPVALSAGTCPEVLWCDLIVAGRTVEEADKIVSEYAKRFG